MDGWMYTLIDGWLDGCTRRTDRQAEGWMYKLIDGWLDGWMDVYIDRWMDGKTE